MPPFNERDKMENKTDEYFMREGHVKIRFGSAVLIFAILFSLFNFAYCFANEAESYYNKGLEHGASGDFENAKVNFEKALEANLTCQSVVKEFIEVIESVKKEQLEKETAIHLFKGADYYIKNKLDDAVLEFNAAIKINPNFANAYKGLGVVYSKKKLDKEAEDAFITAIKINSQYTNARIALVAIYIEKCGRYMQKGKLDQAMVEVDKALDICPDLSVAHWAKGTIYMYKGITCKSEIDLSKAAEKPDKMDKDFLDKSETELKKAIWNPNPSAVDILVLAQAYYILAEVYYFKEEYDLTLKYCDKSAQLGYQVKSSFLKALEPYRKKQEESGIKADECYSGVMTYAINGKFAKAMAEFYQYNTSEWSEATKDLIEVINYALKYNIKKEALICFFNALNRENNGDFDGAIIEYKKAIEIAPNFFYAHYNLSSIYCDEKDMPDEAIIECKKAIEINPNYAWSHARLGGLYLGKEKLKEAIFELKKVIEINPNIPDAYGNLAIAYYNKKEYDLTYKYYIKAINMGLEPNMEFLKILQPYKMN